MLSPLRPSDADLIRGELRAVAASTAVPLTFGGQVIDDTLRITELHGTRTRGLRNLAVPARAGLGGLVIARRRPEVVQGYRDATSITHDFDGPVLGEGISSVAAVPVLVAGKARAVLYAAVRGQLTLGERVIDALGQAARRIGRELHVRDEVERRLALVAYLEPVPSPSLEELREVYADLRALASRVTDDNTRQAIQEMSARMANLGRNTPAPSPLSHREVDVLAAASLGCSTAEIATRLSIRPETAKSYLRSAFTKLEVNNRRAAVVAARRQGLLP